MRFNGFVKPSKPVSAIVVLIGAGMFILGLVEFPHQDSWFGLLWLLGVGAIVGFHLINLLSSTGIAEVNVEFSGSDIKSRLQQLEMLRKNGLITMSEYDDQKKRILNEL